KRGVRSVRRHEEHATSSSVKYAQVQLVVINDFRAAIAIEVKNAGAGHAARNVLRSGFPQFDLRKRRRFIVARRANIYLERNVTIAAGNADFRITIAVKIRDGRRSDTTAARNFHRSPEQLTGLTILNPHA